MMMMSQIDTVEDSTELILQDHQFVTLEKTKEVLYYQNGTYVPNREIVIEKQAEKMFG
jgi:hypothetical protein